MSPFEFLVDDYDAARPGYPASLYEAVAQLTGAPLSGLRLLELGAGTGKQLPGLLAAGADVVSTDLGPRMLGRLRAGFPQVPCVVAAAEALPFADASADGVCAAQMWHWVDVPRAAAEAARVLRPGGWLALWWNDVAAAGLPWWERQQELLEAAGTDYLRDYRSRAYGRELEPLGWTGVRSWTTRWVRALDLATYERWLRSKSYVAALPDQAAFLAAVRADLRQAFPDGVVHEPFQTVLWTAQAPQG